ncbi:MAG: phospholipid carrier-dependent glycosyltransferase [Alphaproteobacteria bacterium]
MERKNWKDLGLLTLTLGLLFFSFLGNRPLSSPDEGRYVEIPREMAQTGEWMTPHLNGLKYFEKPPLVYWVEAATISLSGVNEYFLRLPIAFFALLGCLAVYAFSCRFYSRKTGIWSAIVLATSLLYFSLSRIIILDMVLTVLISSALFSLLAGLKTPLSKSPSRRMFIYLAAGLFALALLCKGLISIALPGLVVLVWMALSQSLDKIKPLYLPTSITIFLAIALPWHVWMIWENPSFFDFYFIHEHFERYFTTVHRRYQPFWFFIPVVILGFFPWIGFIPKALKDFFPLKLKQLKTYDVELFLVLWIALFFMVFSFSQSSLIPYMLPIFPPLAVIVGRYLSYVWKNSLSLRSEGIFYSLFVFALAGAAYYASENGLIDTALFQETQLAQNILIGTGVLVLGLSFLKNVRPMIIALVAGQVLFLFALNDVAYLLQRPSTKPLAEKIKSLYGDSAQVVSYGRYYQDLPPYLNQTVKIVSWSGELDFGKNLEPNNTVFMTPEDLATLWAGPAPVCVVTPRSRVAELQNSLVPEPQEIASVESSIYPDATVLICSNQQ